MSEWRFEVSASGYMYLIGTRDDNQKRWETSHIVELQTMDNCYCIKTANDTVYVLYW